MKIFILIMNVFAVHHWYDSSRHNRFRRWADRWHNFSAFEIFIIIHTYIHSYIYTVCVCKNVYRFFSNLFVSLLLFTCVSNFSMAYLLFFSVLSDCLTFSSASFSFFSKTVTVCCVEANCGGWENGRSIAVMYELRLKVGRSVPDRRRKYGPHYMFIFLYYLVSIDSRDVW